MARKRSRKSRRRSEHRRMPKYTQGRMPRNMSVAPASNLEKLLRNTHQPHLRRILKKELKLRDDPIGSRTRGWAAAAPQDGRPRDTLLRKCGRKCFLVPKHKAFPVCAKCVKGKCDCKLDCKGVVSAKVRARQYHYPLIAKKANKLEKKYCSKGKSRRSRRGRKSRRSRRGRKSRRRSRKSRSRKSRRRSRKSRRRSRKSRRRSRKSRRRSRKSRRRR